MGVWVQTGEKMGAGVEEWGAISYNTDKPENYIDEEEQNHACR